jgi:hypothetical protein
MCPRIFEHSPARRAVRIRECQANTRTDVMDGKAEEIAALGGRTEVVPSEHDAVRPHERPRETTRSAAPP